MLNAAMTRGIVHGELPRKRIITKTRKEQNRVAAKAYRQRQKENLQNLQGESRGIQQLRRRLLPSTKRYPPAADDYLHTEIDETANQRGNGFLFHNSAPPKDSPEDSTVQRETQHQDECLNSNILLPLTPSNSSILVSISSSMSKLDAFDLSPARQPLISAGEYGNLNSTSTPDETRSLNVILDDTLSVTLPGLLSTETSSSISNQNSFSQQDMQPWFLTFPNPAQEDPFGLFQQQEPVSNSLCQILESSNMSSEQLDSLLSYPIQNKVSLISTPSPIADPHTNYIQLWQGSAFTAGLYIAISLNLNLESIRSSNWSSPFYHPTSLSNNPNTLLSSAHVPYAPANLQPTLPQVLFPHHAYLDLIPFPVFRARAITLANIAHGPRCDLWDLKRDINAGLVCWSPGNGTGGGNVQPWDVRSWKAAPWFLRKWRMLISEDV